MELSQLVKDFDELERLKRQAINPLANLELYQPPDYRMHASVMEIVNHTREFNERIDKAFQPLEAIRFPTFEKESLAIYDAMQPMRDAAAVAVKGAQQIYDSMQPIRDAIRSLEEHSRLMDVMEPARRLAQDTSLNQIVRSTDFINQIVAESDFLARTKVFRGYGANLALTLSPLANFHQNWLSSIGRFDGATIDFFGPTIAAPSREVERSFKETQIIIGDDYEEELIERPNLPELKDLISQVSPTLLPSYRGALKRMNEVGDDYQRQAVTSLRTFIQSLMMELAPNEVVAAYLMATQGKPLTGKPSWSLRIEAAYDSLGQPALTDTMKSRVKIMVLNIEILQKSVHELPELHTHDQLQHFFNNALGSVRNILEVFYLARLKR